MLCHSSQNDWFASTSEPRLGQCVRLAADIPAGGTSVRVNAIHLESSDFTGEKRVVQARELLDSAQVEACDRPQVIAGDWNAWYCTAPELEVLRRSGFVDATRIAGEIECGIRTIPIAETGGWRSPKPEHGDHRNRSMAIAETGHPDHRNR